MRIVKLILSIVFFVLFTLLYLLPFSLLWGIGLNAEDKDYLYFNWILDVFFEKLYDFIDMI